MKVKLALVIACFLVSPIAGLAQTALSEMAQEEGDPIDGLIKSSVSTWVEAMNFFLTTSSKEYDDYLQEMFRKDRDAYREGKDKELDSNMAFQVFMCNDDDDNIYARYSTGKKRKILPTITMTFSDVSSGKSFTAKKTIRDIRKYLGKMKYDIDHIDVVNVQVYLVDDAKKMKGRDTGEFTYYAEHIFAIADYLVENGAYKMINHENDSFYINRGKSYWDLNRDEEKLLRKDNVVVILGDVSLNVFYK